MDELELSKKEKSKENFECELCIESYNLFDKKPLTLVPCGHSLCNKCSKNLVKNVCPYCRLDFEKTIPNWEIIKRLPKPIIPIAFYQVEIKLNNLKQLHDNFNNLNTETNNEMKKQLDKLKKQTDQMKKSDESEEANKTNEKFIQFEKNLNQNFMDNCEVEKNLSKKIEKFKSRLELDEYKYSEEKLKEMNNDLDKLLNSIKENINLINRENEKLKEIFSSNEEEKAIKELENEFEERKKSKSIAQQLLILIDSHQISPVSTPNRLNSNTTATHPPEDRPVLTLSLFEKFVVSSILFVILVISVIYPLAMIIIGGLFKDDCPANRFIPIWLIVTGSVSIAIATLIFAFLINLIFKFFESKPVLHKIFNNLIIFTLITISIFNLAWFFAGNAWIYSTHKNVQSNSKQDSATYCQETVFQFAFWTLNISYIFVGLTILILNSVCCCFCCLKK